MNEFTDKHWFDPDGNLHPIRRKNAMHGDFIFGNHELFGYKSRNHALNDHNNDRLYRRAANRGFIRGEYYFGNNMGYDDDQAHNHILTYESATGGSLRKFENALRTLHRHYSQHPRRKFSIELTLMDEDATYRIAEKIRKITGKDDLGYITSLEHIEKLIGGIKDKPTVQPVKKTPKRESIPVVDTSRLEKEPNMGQGNMTTAEWNFWRRKGLGDSYIPIMGFKQFIREQSEKEKLKNNFDTIVNSPKFKEEQDTDRIRRVNSWMLVGHNVGENEATISPDIAAMKEKVFGKRTEGTSHLWWYHRDHGLIMHPAIGDLTHAKIEEQDSARIYPNVDRKVSELLRPSESMISKIGSFVGIDPKTPSWIEHHNNILARGRIEHHEGGGGHISFAPGEMVDPEKLYEPRRKLPINPTIVRTLGREFPKHKIMDAFGNMIENTIMKNFKNLLSESIRKTGDEYTILSKKGKKLGKYGSKEAALKRLKQIEWFKRHRNY